MSLILGLSVELVESGHFVNIAAYGALYMARRLEDVCLVHVRSQGTF